MEEFANLINLPKVNNKLEKLELTFVVNFFPPIGWFSFRIYLIPCLSPFLCWLILGLISLSTEYSVEIVGATIYNFSWCRKVKRCQHLFFVAIAQSLLLFGGNFPAKLFLAFVDLPPTGNRRKSWFHSRIDFLLGLAASSS